MMAIFYELVVEDVADRDARGQQVIKESRAVVSITGKPRSLGSGRPLRSLPIDNLNKCAVGAEGESAVRRHLETLHQCSLAVTVQGTLEPRAIAVP
jgi:hypothetical protein